MFFLNYLQPDYCLIQKKEYDIFVLKQNTNYLLIEYTLYAVYTYTKTNTKYLKFECI